MFVAVLLLSSLIDLPADLRAGPVSIGAILTVGYALTAWLLWIRSPSLGRKALGPVLWFGLFVLWGLSTLWWHDPGTEGAQNLTVFVAVFGLLLYSAREFARLGPRPVFELALPAAVWIGTAFFFITAMGTPIGVGYRAYALFVLLGVAWYLAEWQTGRRGALKWALLLTAIIGLSLSRTAMVTALLLIPVAQYRPQSWRRLAGAIAWTIVAGVVLFAAISYITPLRDRFFAGDPSLRVGGVAINAMGRVLFWQTTLQSFAESPIVGKGAGAVQAVIEDKLPGMGHPHNDYLRILHDYGLIGFGLWALAGWLIVRTVWKAWVAEHRRGDHASARIHLAAFLATTTVICGMATDNTIVYIWVMAPWSLLVGASLGLSSRKPVESASTSRSYALAAPEGTPH